MAIVRGTHDVSATTGGRRLSRALVSLLIALGWIAGYFLIFPTAIDAAAQPDSSPYGDIERVDYVAMGDSYSSGEGSPPYDSGSGQRDRVCHRSREAWPRQLANISPEIRAPLLVACTGAETKHVEHWYKGSPPQTDALSLLISNEGNRDLLTMSIGGNDAGFGNWVFRCTIATCSPQWLRYIMYYDVDKAAEKVGRLLGSVDSRLRSMRANPYRVLVGYPRFFPKDPSQQPCRALVYASGINRLTREEQLALNDAANRLDRALRATANRSGWQYVSLLDAFEGHEICTEQPYMWGFEKVSTPGGGGYGSMRFHPNASGYSKMARAVFESISFN